MDIQRAETISNERVLCGDASLGDLDVTREFLFLSRGVLTFLG
jgi:hypothetical protein